MSVRDRQIDKAHSSAKTAGAMVAKSCGLQKGGSRRVKRKLSIGIDVSVEQWRQGSAIRGGQSLPQAFAFNRPFDQKGVDEHEAVLEKLQ